MRASKIIKILMIIVLVLSVILSITIFVSSSFKLVFKDNLEAREKIVKNTEFNLESNEESYGLSFYHKYKEDETTLLEESVSCVYVEKVLKCSQLEKMYSIDENGNPKLVRTSFTNDEKNLYVSDGTSKVKKRYSGESLEAKANNLLAEFKSLVPSLKDSSDEKNNVFVQYDVSLDFIFNTFSLNKKIAYTCLDHGVKTKIDYVVDTKDRVTSVSKDGVSISFIYGDYKLELPSTDGYVEE